MSDNYVGYKIPIYPTEEQKKIFEDYFNMSRTVYNLGLYIHDKFYKENINNKDCKYKTLSAIGMRNILMEMRNRDKKYFWLKNFNRESIMSILKDVALAFKRFSTGQSKFSKYKKKKYNSNKSFPTRDDRLSVYEDTVKVSSIGYIKCNNSFKEIIGSGNKNKNMNYVHFCNSRIKYDGCNYYLCFNVKITPVININSYIKYGGNNIYIKKQYSNPIGIDIGCKRNNWIVDSTGTRVCRPDTSKEKKKIKQFRKKLSRQYKEQQKLFKGKKTNSTLTNSSKEVYTKNQQKTLYKLNKYHKRITNKKKSCIYEYTNLILDKKPQYVVIEDINEKDMLIQDKNINSVYRSRHNSLVKDAIVYTLQHIITYKCQINNIPVIVADKSFPSTQICSSCGNRIKVGKKSVYNCPCCGLNIDRDYNAAINLSNYNNHINISCIA